MLNVHQKIFEAIKHLTKFTWFSIWPTPVLINVCFFGIEHCLPKSDDRDHQLSN